MTNGHLGWRGLLCLCLMGIGIPQIWAQSDHLQQQVISSSGDVSRTGQASLDWTLGQTSGTTLYADQHMLTQGFQQPMLRVIAMQTADVASKPHLAEADFTVAVFPNPTRGELSITTQAPQALSGHWRLTDARGQVIQSQTFELDDYAYRLDLAHVPAGIYLLQVWTDEQANRQSYQIIKN